MTRLIGALAPLALGRGDPHVEDALNPDSHIVSYFGKCGRRTGCEPVSSLAHPYSEAACRGGLHAVLEEMQALLEAWQVELPVARRVFG